MKIKVVGMMTALLESNAMAKEVHLFCAGSYNDTSANGKSGNVARELKFDEQASTAAITNDKADWKKLKDLEFSEGEIKARQSGSLYTLGTSYEMTLNRYTGILTVGGLSYSAVLQCKLIDKKKPLF